MRTSSKERAEWRKTNGMTRQPGEDLDSILGKMLTAGEFERLLDDADECERLLIHIRKVNDFFDEDPHDERAHHALDLLMEYPKGDE